MSRARQTSLARWWPPDLREEIFREVMDVTVEAAITAWAPGVLSGVDQVVAQARSMGLDLTPLMADGQQVAAGAVVARLRGDPFQITRAEDLLLGSLSKTSGVATMANQARLLAGESFRVVCGGFKKMPAVLKPALRRAVRLGGLDFSLARQPFVYLDKNYVRILGGIGPALKAVAHLPGKAVIQVRGEFDSIDAEAVKAALSGAGIVMVDTGKLDDLDRVSSALAEAGLRSGVEIAFAGEIQIEHLPVLREHDLDAVDIGYAIVDAPCLPMRLDVTSQVGA